MTQTQQGWISEFIGIYRSAWPLLKPWERRVIIFHHVMAAICAVVGIAAVLALVL